MQTYVITYSITYVVMKQFALSPSNLNKELCLLCMRPSYWLPLALSAVHEAVLLAPIRTGHASFPGETYQPITTDRPKVHTSRTQTKVVFLK